MNLGSQSTRRLADSRSPFFFAPTPGWGTGMIVLSSETCCSKGFQILFCPNGSSGCVAKGQQQVGPRWPFWPGRRSLMSSHRSFGNSFLQVLREKVKWWAKRGRLKKRGHACGETQKINRLDYSQFLFNTQTNYTLTYFSDHIEEVSLDVINRYLKNEKLSPKLIWAHAKKDVIPVESGSIVFDDTVLDNPILWTIKKCRSWNC